MKQFLPLLFAMLALANRPAATTTACESIVTEVVFETFYTCPCTPTTTLASTTSSGGGQVSPSLTATTSALNSTTTAASITTSSNMTTTASNSSLTTTSTSSPVTTPFANTTTSAASQMSSSTTTVTSSATSSAPPGSTQTVQLSSLGDYQTRALYSHNLHRANASIPALVWNTTMATWASQLAATCVYGHSRAQGDGNYGQNIGAGFTEDQIPLMITNNMYNNEIGKYPGPYGSNNIDTTLFEDWGHYSQLVWTSTTSVGCATQYCPNGLQNSGTGTQPYFTVCNYYPSGNFDGQWAQVAQPRGGATVVFA